VRWSTHLTIAAATKALFKELLDTANERLNGRYERLPGTEGQSATSTEWAIYARPASHALTTRQTTERRPTAAELRGGADFPRPDWLPGLVPPGAGGEHMSYFVTHAEPHPAT
jgi:hypothetical protein